MTQTKAVDAIMKVMQDFVDSERLKIWNLHKAWREKAERFIQLYIEREKNSPQDALNQVYIKGPFVGGSVGSVLNCARELLKTNGHTTQFMDEELDTRSNIQTAFPSGHRYLCAYGTVGGKVIPCDCGLHDALKKIVKE